MARSWLPPANWPEKSISMEGDMDLLMTADLSMTACLSMIAGLSMIRCAVNGVLNSTTQGLPLPRGFEP
jgi:hypothetical protein